MARSDADLYDGMAIMQAHIARLAQQADGEDDDAALAHISSALTIFRTLAWAAQSSAGDGVGELLYRLGKLHHVALHEGEGGPYGWD